MSPESRSRATATETEDRAWMQRALELARRAVDVGEVPVGAVVVRGDRLLAEAHNRRDLDSDPTAHAEVLALRSAARREGSWRLRGATLYVTLEPCAMCAGALVSSRVDRLVYGAVDPKAGFSGSLGDITQDPRLNHRLTVVSGVLATESAELLREFFAERRRASSSGGSRPVP